MNNRSNEHKYTVKVQYESLKDALETIKPVIARKPTLPILSNVMIVAEGSTMTITGSDLQKSQIVTIPAYVYEPLAITLPYRTLYDVIALASPEILHFSVDNQTHTATISQASYAWKCNIKGISIEEYPHISTNESATLLAMVDYVQLKEIARLAVKSASTEVSRPILNCARIDIEPGKIRYSTVNGYQLFETSLLAEADSTYTAYVPAKSLYDILAKMKDKPDTIEIYGTAIDESGRVKGSLFLNDSQLQTHETGDFKPEQITPGDNATIHTVQPALLESLSDTIWQNKKAELITIKGKDWNFAFIEYEKKSRSRSAKLTVKNKAEKIESMPFTIAGYGFEIGNVTELADFMRYTVKNKTYGDNTLFITKFGGFVEFRWQDMRLVINASHPGKELKAEHTKEQYTATNETVKQLKQAENIAATHIEFQNHGLEYSQGKIFVYRVIDEQKCYIATLTHYGKISELWHKIRKDYTSELIPRASITRWRTMDMKKLADTRVNEIWNVTRTMIRYFEQIQALETLPECAESPNFADMLATSDNWLDSLPECEILAWNMPAHETESIVESATIQAIEEHEAKNTTPAGNEQKPFHAKQILSRVWYLTSDNKPSREIIKTVKYWTRTVRGTAHWNKDSKRWELRNLRDLPREVRQHCHTIDALEPVIAYRDPNNIRNTWIDNSNACEYDNLPVTEIGTIESLSLQAWTPHTPEIGEYLQFNDNPVQIGRYLGTYTRIGANAFENVTIVVMLYQNSYGHLKIGHLAAKNITHYATLPAHEAENIGIGTTVQLCHNGIPEYMNDKPIVGEIVRENSIHGQTTYDIKTASGSHHSFVKAEAIRKHEAENKPTPAPAGHEVENIPLGNESAALLPSGALVELENGAKCQIATSKRIEGYHATQYFYFYIYRVRYVDGLMKGQYADIPAKKIKRLIIVIETQPDSPSSTSNEPGTTETELESVNKDNNMPEAQNKPTSKKPSHGVLALLAELGYMAEIRVKVPHNDIESAIGAKVPEFDLALKLWSNKLTVNTALKHGLIETHDSGWVTEYSLTESGYHWYSSDSRDTLKTAYQFHGKRDTDTLEEQALNRLDALEAQNTEPIAESVVEAQNIEPVLMPESVAALPEGAIVTTLDGKKRIITRFCHADSRDNYALMHTREPRTNEFYLLSYKHIARLVSVPASPDNTPDNDESPDTGDSSKPYPQIGDTCTTYDYPGVWQIVDNDPNFKAYYTITKLDEYGKLTKESVSLSWFDMLKYGAEIENELAPAPDESPIIEDSPIEADNTTPAPVLVLNEKIINISDLWKQSATLPEVPEAKNTESATLKPLHGIQADKWYYIHHWNRTHGYNRPWLVYVREVSETRVKFYDKYTHDKEERTSPIAEFRRYVAEGRKLVEAMLQDLPPQADSYPFRAILDYGVNVEPAQLTPDEAKIKAVKFSIDWTEAGDKYEGEYSSWDAINQALQTISGNIKTKGYDKTGFTVTFADGHTYSGRLDVSREGDNNLALHIYEYQAAVAGLVWWFGRNREDFDMPKNKEDRESSIEFLRTYELDGYNGLDDGSYTHRLATSGCIRYEPAPVPAIEPEPEPQPEPIPSSPYPDRRPATKTEELNLPVIRMDSKDTAKIIREDLKATYPGVKFSVRTGWATHNRSIDVTWQDGPTGQEVRFLLGKYQNEQPGEWGSTHLYWLVDGQVIDYGTRFIMGQRSLSDGFIYKIARHVCQKFGLDETEMIKAEGKDIYDRLSSLQIKNLGGERFRDYVYREARSTSALEAPEAENTTASPAEPETLEHGEIQASRVGLKWVLSGDTKPVKDIIKQSAKDAGLRYKFNNLLQWLILGARELPPALVELATDETESPTDTLNGNGIQAEQIGGLWYIFGDTKPHKELMKESGAQWDGANWVNETLTDAIRALFEDDDTPPTPPAPEPTPPPAEDEAEQPEAENKRIDNFDWGTWGNPYPNLNKQDLWYGPRSRWYNMEKLPRPSVTLKTEWGEFVVEWNEDGNLYGQVVEPVELFTVRYRVQVRLTWNTIDKKWMFGSWYTMRLGADDKPYGEATTAARKQIAAVLEKPMRQIQKHRPQFLEQTKRIHELNLLAQANAKLDNFLEEIAYRRAWLQMVENERTANGHIHYEDIRKLEDIWGSHWKLH